jgi:hypothetical protein
MIATVYYEKSDQDKPSGTHSFEPNASWWFDRTQKEELTFWCTETPHSLPFVK